MRVAVDVYYDSVSGLCVRSGVVRPTHAMKLHEWGTGTLCDGRKEALEVCGGEGGEGFRSDAAEICEERGGVDDQGWLVALAAMGNGSKEWGVRLDEDAVSGGEGCGITNACRSRVSEVSGEGEIEAKIERAPGVGQIAREAVHYSRDTVRRPVFGDQGEKVVLGIGSSVLFFRGRVGEFAGAAVDQDGLACGCGNLHLRDESCLLGGDVGVLEVVVVEANLAKGDALFVADQYLEFCEVFWCGLLRFLWMDAGAGVDVWVGSGDIESAVHGGRTIAYADGQESVDAGGFGIGEDSCEVIWFGVEVEMAVGVDEHKSDMEDLRPTSQNRDLGHLCVRGCAESGCRTSRF